MADETDKLSIMIIGGGSAGRLMAQNCKQQGIPYTLFEREESFESRTRDWNIGIYWAQEQLESCLPPALHSKIMDTQVDHRPPDPDYYVPLFDGSTGELMYKMPAPNSLRIRRKAFLTMLGEGIDIQYGKRLVSFDTTSGPGVTATFADGTTAHASILLGADGAHSAVRKQLLGPDAAAAHHMPLLMNITICKLPLDLVQEFQARHQRICTVYHPNGCLFFITLHDAHTHPDTPTEWTFTIGLFWPQDPPVNPWRDASSADIIHEIKRRMSGTTTDGGWAEPWASIAAALDDTAPAYSSFVSYWPTARWDSHPARGKVTLMGDAAHPMPPHRGSGLGNAIQDAQRLGQELQEIEARTAAGGREAVRRYEEEMWPRGAETVRVTVETATAALSFEGLKRSSLFTRDLNDRVA